MTRNVMFALRLASLTLLFAAAPAVAQEWTITLTSAPNLAWNSIAMSADGTKVAAASVSGVYVSTNSGMTWILSGLTNAASQAVYSADGSNLFAASSGIYRSMNAGATWSLTGAPTNVDWFSIVVSADGTKLAGGGDPGGTYISRDAGMTWQQTAFPGGPLTCSADGSNLVAAFNNGGLYVSHDFGATWTAQIPNAFGISVVSSADGAKFAAIVHFPGSDEYGDGLDIGLLYTTVDSGATWNQTSGLTNNMGYSSDLYQPVWLRLTSSADGIKLAAAGGVVGYSQYGSGDVYAAAFSTSTNSGANWTRHTITNYAITTFNRIAGSADGNVLFASANRSVSDYPDNNGPIYRLQSTPTPSLSITPSGTNALISWVIPSIPFTLQQSPNLANWTDVSTQPVLNYTNLHNEVILSPPSTGNVFYRLKH